MRRAVKYLAIVLGSLVALGVIAVAVVVNLDFNDYKYLIEERVRAETGRDLHIRGRLDVDLSLQPSVTVTDIRFANAPWGSSPDMMTVEHLSAQLDLMPYITDGVIDVQKVDLRGVDMLVEKHRDGQSNLEFRELKSRKPSSETDAQPEPVETEPVAFSLPILRDVTLAEINVTYNDLGTGERRNLAVNTLTVGGEGPFRPLAIDLDGEADGIPLTMAGELGSPSEMLNPDRIWTIDLQGDLAGTAVTIAGGIDEPAAGRGINVILSSETPEIGTLSRISKPLAGQEIPNLGPLKLSVLLAGDADGEVSASDILVSLGRADGVQLELSGAVADILRPAGVDLKGSVAVPDISALSDVAGQPIPALGALTSDFVIRGDVQDGVALDDFSFELARDGVLQLSGKGVVGDLMTRRGIDMRIDLLVPDVKKLPAINGGELPDAGRIEAGFVVVGDMANAIALRDMKAALGRKDVYQLNLEGEIADLMKQAGIDIGFDFATPNPALLSSLAQTDIPAMAATNVAGRLQGGATETASIQGLAIKIGKSDMSGDISVENVARRPKLFASLSSNVLRLEDLKIGGAGRKRSGGDGQASAPGPSSRTSGKGDRVIPDDPIDLSGLRMADADISLDIKKLTLPRGQFQDGQVKLVLQDGILKVVPLSLADDKGGKLTGSLALDARREAADLTVDLKADKLEVSNLMRLAGQPGVIEGPLEMALELTAQGRSAHELAANLNGGVNAAVTEGFVNSEETRRAFGRATQVIADLLLGNSKEKRIPLYCFVADYKAKDGVVTTDSLVLDTKISTILSSGSTNLGTEKLDLTVTPTRDVMGLGASIPVRVQGTLAKPKVFADPALAAVGIGSALLGAPLIPLEMLGDAVLANDNDSPCVNLRPENREKQAQPADVPSTDGQEKKDPKEQLEEAGKKAIDNILKGVLQGD